MEANLVSPIVVMIVALTALGSLAVPNEEFAAAFRLLKYVFLVREVAWGFMVLFWEYILQQDIWQGLSALEFLI